jgi:hypothetical protein
VLITSQGTVTRIGDTGISGEDFGWLAVGAGGTPFIQNFQELPRIHFTGFGEKFFEVHNTNYRSWHRYWRKNIHQVLDTVQCGERLRRCSPFPVLGNWDMRLPVRLRFFPLLPPHPPTAQSAQMPWLIFSNLHDCALSESTFYPFSYLLGNVIGSRSRTYRFSDEFV